MIRIEPKGDDANRGWVAERFRVAWGGEPLVAREVKGIRLIGSFGIEMHDAIELEKRL